MPKYLVTSEWGEDTFETIEDCRRHLADLGRTDFAEMSVYYASGGFRKMEVGLEVKLSLETPERGGKDVKESEHERTEDGKSS